jgi:hypothetical protein
MIRKPPFTEDFPAMFDEKHMGFYDGQPAHDLGVCHSCALFTAHGKMIAMSTLWV